MSITRPLRSSNRQPLNEGEREARSVIVYSCSAQWRWQAGLGMVLITVAVTVAWWLMEISDRMALMEKAFGHVPPLPPQQVAAFGFGCSILCVLNAAMLFNCASRLRSFAASRRVLDLHAALRRLRLMWGVFAVSAAMVTGVMVWAVFTGKLPLLR